MEAGDHLVSSVWWFWSQGCNNLVCHIKSSASYKQDCDIVISHEKIYFIFVLAQNS